MIDVFPYDPDWPRPFEALRNEYSNALEGSGVSFSAIKHIGSTSVRGLAAKPVIDCDIVVASDEVERASDGHVGLGFRLLGELGIAQRWAFTEPSRLAGTNTFVTVEGCPSLRTTCRCATSSDPNLNCVPPPR